MNRPGPDWFTDGYAQRSFERHLLPEAGRPRYEALQIGAYCGDASVWLLENVLTGFGSWLVDVDTWSGSDEEEHHEIDWEAVRAFYTDRLRNDHKHGVFHGTSDAYFELKPAFFDFIYVDGDHTAEQVLRDAVNADKALKVGGLLAFDDYAWGLGEDRPKTAVDAFLSCYAKRYEVLELGLQAWARKVA